MKPTIKDPDVKQFKEWIQFLREKRYPSHEADQIAELIRKAISPKLTWRRLGITDKGLTNLVRQNRITHLKRCIKLLRRCAYPPHTAAQLTMHLGWAVEKCLVTWMELDITRTRLEKLERHNNLYHLRQRLNLLREGDCLPEDAILVAGDIIKAVKAGEATWKKIDCTKSGLNQLVRKSSVRQLQRCLGKIRYRCFNRPDAAGLAKTIRRGIRGKVISWKKLGVTAKQLKALVKRCRK